MRILRRGLAILLCASMLISLTAMAAEDEHEHDVEAYAAETDGRTVELNAGKGAVTETEVVLDEDGRLPELPAAVRTGWTFVGWYTDEVSENYWGDDNDETLERLQQETGLDIETCKEMMFTWIIRSGGDKVSAGDMPAEDVTTLYAMYEPTRVSVIWYTNGWNNQYREVLRDDRVQYDSPIAPYDLTLHYPWEGRSFDGWYDAPEGGNLWTFHAVNDYEMSDLPVQVSGELKLYAHWSGGPAATAIRLTAKQYAEPGQTVSITASYSPNGVNRPTITWTTDSADVTVASTDGLTAAFSVSKDADVISSPKVVTVTATTAEGVSATTEISICHSWDNGRTTKWSSCTEGGAVEYTCKVCGVKKIVEFPADGHRFTLVTAAATCTSDGYQDRVCVVCGLTERVSSTSALGHNWNVTTIKSCTGTVTTKTCDACGLTEVDSVADGDHEWETEPTVDKAPTCFTEGSQSIHCRNCDVTKESTALPADPELHQWNDWKVTKEPMVGESGLMERVCGACGAKETVELDPLPDVSDIFTEIPDAAVDQTLAEEALLKALQSAMASADSNLGKTVQAAREMGQDITVALEVTTDLTPNDTGKFEALSGGMKLRYVGIEIVVKVNGERIGEPIPQTSDAITISVLLDSSENGRIVLVLREHEGKVEMLPAYVNGGAVVFTTDKFSTFAIGLTNDIAFASVDAIPDQAHTGSEIRPAVNVTINGSETLIEGKDYTVSYRDNVNIGTAAAIVTGIGDFAGTEKEVGFNIIKTTSSSESDSTQGTNPTPETDPTPTPETDPTPAPETDPNPVPETDPTPAPETDPTPESGTNPNPAPETGSQASAVQSPDTGEGVNLAFWVTVITLAFGFVGLFITRQKKVK